jgi:hypothetical protein
VKTSLLRSFVCGLLGHKEPGTVVHTYSPGKSRDGVVTTSRQRIPRSTLIHTETVKMMCPRCGELSIQKIIVES